MRLVCVALVLALGCGKPRAVKPTAPEVPKDSVSAGPLLIEVGDAKLEGDLLIVTVYLTNRERGAGVKFQSWQKTDTAARDDVGNGYRGREVPPAIQRDIRKILADEGDKVALGSGLLDWHHPRVDVLAFDRPAPIASSVVITLKGDNIDTTSGSPIRLFIPSSLWTH